MIQFTSQRSEALRFPFALENAMTDVETTCANIDTQRMNELGRPLKFEEFAAALQVDNGHFVVEVNNVAGIFESTTFIKSL
jgi:hypothetical protein